MMCSRPANWLRRLRSHQGYFVGLFALLYFGAIPLGNTFLITQGNAVSFWPAAGLFLAALLLSKMRHWPFILSAAIVAEAAANGLLFDSALGLGRATLAGAVFGFINGLEAFAGAFLLRRFFHISLNLAKLQTVFGLALWGAVVGAAVGATVGSTFLIIIYPDTAYWTFWQGWWLSNVLGILVVTPALLSWANNGPPSVHLRGPARLIEGCLLFEFMIVVIQWGFGATPEIIQPGLLFPYMLYPFLLWAALRFSPRVVTTLLLVMAFLLAVNAVQGRGPFMTAAQSGQVNLIALQVFLALTILSTLILAAVVSEQHQARLDLAEERNLLRTVIDNVPDMIYAKDRKGRFLVTNRAVANNFRVSSSKALMGKTDFDFPERTSLEKARLFQADEQSVIQTGQLLLNKDIAEIDPAGHPTWHTTSRAPLRDQQGQIVGTVGVTRNITERKEAEEALQQYAERLRILHEIDQAILAAHSPQEIAEVALHHIRRLITCQRAGLLTFDLTAQEAVWVAVDSTVATETQPGTRESLDPFPDIMALFQQNQILKIDPIAMQQKRFQRLQNEGIHTAVYVPMLAQGVLMGALGLESSLLQIFSLEQEAIIREIAAQLAVALQQAQLRTAEIQRRQEAEALQDTAAVLNSTLDLAEVLDRILDNVGRVVPHDAANIMFIESGVARLVQQRGYAKFGLEEMVLKLRLIIADTANLRRMVQTGCPLTIPDTHLDPEWQGEWVRSYASAPIRFRGETLGFLNLDSPTPNFFTMTDAERLQAFADQAAIALDNARLHQEIRHYAEELEQRVADRTRELAALYEVTAVASESPDVEGILNHSLVSVLNAMRSDIGAICLLDEPSGDLNLVAHQGLSAEMLATSWGHDLSRGVIERDEPLLVSDTKSDTRTMPLNLAEAYAYAGVPMRASGQPLGVITILRDPNQPAFTAEELALLSSIADQVGVVVESARLRQQANQAAVMEERRRLARDLHDSVTQLLYSLNLFASVGQEACRQGDLRLAEQSLAELSGTAKQALKEMRLLVYELRPPILEHDGLVGALQYRLDAVEGRAGVETRLLVEGNPALPAPVEDALYHITQEALNNILKHAVATAVTVKLETNGAGINLEIRDNGKGFDPQMVAGQGGLGLVSMRERVEQLQGQLTIESVPEQGTTIKVSLTGLTQLT